MSYKKRKIKNQNNKILSNWESEECFQDQNNIFNALISDINKAENTIKLEMFIFELDSIGNSILDNLIKAAKKGVVVKLVVDGLGSPSFTPDITNQLTKKGINIKIYKPVSQFLNKIKKSITNLEINIITKEVSSMNTRNHRKVCIIDNKIGWVGSANISENYKDWRETMVRVTGDSICKLNEGFDWVWNNTEKSFIQQRVKNIKNKIVYNKFHSSNKNNKMLIIQSINAAKKRIQIINPYFIPPYHLLISILHARQRGVIVEILTSNKSDYFFTRWFTQSYYQALLKQGVKIYEHTEKFIHSKVLIVDDQAIIGTSNYNYRSNYSDWEIDLLVSNPKTILDLQNQWEKDIESSILIKNSENTFLWNKFIELLNPLKKIS